MQVSEPGERAAVLARLTSFRDRARAFSGWEIEVQSVPLDPAPPWDYGTLVQVYGSRATRALDMGTGGGERLARWRDSLPDALTATEEWHVNAPLAHGRLAPLGVGVVRCRSLVLPFADGAVDLVLNRHEELDPAEVVRVLRPGGAVLTQQVGGEYWQELRPFFPRMTDYGDLFEDYRSGLTSAGMEIIQARRHLRRFAYADLGEIVYLLSIMPWVVPDFDLESDLDALLAAERALRTADGIVLTEPNFLLVARRPA